jgi:uncharacterized protein (DUF1778 family)
MLAPLAQRRSALISCLQNANNTVNDQQIADLKAEVVQLFLDILSVWLT